jgi:XTP/dITP diphosphohydrolase
MRLNIITSNRGKLEEFRAALAPLGIEVAHLPIGYEEVQVDTLEEVVDHGLKELRARGVGDLVIDDSGLFIDALKGFPGVYSAYALRTLGNQGVLRLMEGVEDRGARFTCCIGSSIAGMEDIVVCESCEGHIAEDEKGAGGFGFDPIFMPVDEDMTFAQMPMVEKNAISHRGKAIRSFVEALRQRTGQR